MRVLRALLWISKRSHGKADVVRRTYGRVRWGFRYRVYPRTNVWVVIVGFVVCKNIATRYTLTFILRPVQLFTLGFQWFYWHWYHKRMQTAARMTQT